MENKITTHYIVEMGLTEQHDMLGQAYYDHPEGHFIPIDYMDGIWAFKPHSGGDITYTWQEFEYKYK